MARPVRASRQIESLDFATDQFPSEADAFPSEIDASPSATRLRGPTIVVVPKNEDWDWFPPEEPEPYAVPAESQQLGSMFAYDSAFARGPSAEAPRLAITDAWPLDAAPLKQPAGTRWRHGVVAAAVGLALLAPAAIFGWTMFSRQVVPVEEAQLAHTPSTSPSPLPVELAPAVRASSRKPATTATRTPPPPAASPRPVQATPPPSLSQGTVAPVPLLSIASLNAPPAVSVAPAIARVESVNAVEASPAVVSAAPEPAPTTAPRVSDTAAIESLLTRYRSAFAALDVNAVEAVWPTVNVKALGNAFNQLQAQKVDFERCQIDVKGPQANAVCRGTASFVPAVGSKTPRVESRRWTFQLGRLGGVWAMERVESR
jgi:hypothetical protein